jgi:hypothetical protein
MLFKLNKITNGYIQFPKPYKRRYFHSRDINLGFDITSTIKMQFKLSGSIQSAFSWSTLDNTFTVNNPLTGAITMNKGF